MLTVKGLPHAAHSPTIAILVLPCVRWIMDYDENKVDEVVLALLWLTLHEGDRAWKSHDWDALDRLHAKGLISNPATAAKSVVLTDEGMKPSEELFQKHFGKSSR